MSNWISSLKCEVCGENYATNGEVKWCINDDCCNYGFLHPITRVKESEGE